MDGGRSKRAKATFSRTESCYQNFEVDEAQRGHHPDEGTTNSECLWAIAAERPLRRGVSQCLFSFSASQESGRGKLRQPELKFCVPEHARALGRASEPNGSALRPVPNTFSDPPCSVLRVAWSEDVERSYWPSEPNLCGLFGKNRPYRAMIGYGHRKRRGGRARPCARTGLFFSADRLVLLSWHSPGCWAPVILSP